MLSIRKLFIPFMIGLVILAVVMAGCVSENQTTEPIISESVDELSEIEKLAKEQWYEGFYQSYFYGNYNEAFKWYLMAANNGSVDAMIAVYNYYTQGKGTTKNPLEGLKWLKKAADAENPEAMAGLAAIYIAEIYTGTGIQYAKAFELSSKSAEAGDINGMACLATCYHRGYGTVKDEEKAFEWNLKAAKAGNEVVYFNVGYCYEYGIGTEVNKNAAIKWYKKAVDSGNSDAEDDYERVVASL